MVKILSMFICSKTSQNSLMTKWFYPHKFFAVFLFTVNCIWIFIISTSLYHLYQVTVSGDRYQYLWDYQEDYFQMQACLIRQRICFAHFGMKLGDWDKPWTPHSFWRVCVQNLRASTNMKKKKLGFWFFSSMDGATESLWWLLLLSSQSFWI